MGVFLQTIAGGAVALGAQWRNFLRSQGGMGG